MLTHSILSASEYKYPLTMVKLCGMYIPYLHKSLVYPSIEKKASSSGSYPRSPFAVLKMYIIESVGAGFMRGLSNLKEQLHKAKVCNFYVLATQSQFESFGRPGELWDKCHASIGHQAVTGHALTKWSWNHLTRKKVTSGTYCSAWNCGFRSFCLQAT